MSASIDPAWWVEIINKGTLAFVAFVAMIVGPILQWRIASSSRQRVCKAPDLDR